ncbi:LOW QUALITY PROTEIN: transmembrane protein 270 [Monodelphis domestica]|uniref:LOW QUALITY PROTEIN: transmembrane protein 270 n=1 Tax=Monodelphis domestica TaxID=13616 RepID=UPI0024E22E62|nr:LOW QUALITY PROTEIN: transmembrane protein 270 [Monodelphis domestica]
MACEGGRRGARMADALRARSSIPGLLLQTAKISVLLFQNRIHLYNFLLLKIFLFNHWVSGLAQEAEGAGCLVPAPSPSCLFCPLGSLMRSLAPGQCPAVPGSAGAGHGPLAPAQLPPRHLPPLPASLGQLGFFWSLWKNLLHYWFQSLLLGVLVVLLITWRLCQTAHRFSIKQLRRLVSGQRAGQQPGVTVRGGTRGSATVDVRGRRASVMGWPRCCWIIAFSLEFLGLLRQLYWHVESTAALTSWHLAYVVTWATCLASHMLEAAFEHTARLAQAQEGETDMVWEDSAMEVMLPEEPKVLDE